MATPTMIPSENHKPKGKVGAAPYVALDSDKAYRAPIFVSALGTSGVKQLRHLRRKFLRDLGEVPAYVVMFGVDTTAQDRDEVVEPLPDAGFCNLGEGHQLQERLRLAPFDPRVGAYIPREAAYLPVSDGVGGIAAVARFFLEENLSPLAAKLSEVLGPFQGAARAKMAAKANQLRWLHENNIAVTADGPIDGILVGSTTGGTVNVLTYYILLLKKLFREMGIEANLTLLLTPPASGDMQSVDTKYRAQNTYAQFQELADGNEGRRLVWPASDELVLEGTGPFYEAVYILPEPRLTALETHHHTVGELLFHLAMPIGKTLRGKAVDMLKLFRDRGPRGQPKFLSSMGFSVLCATAFKEVEGFVHAQLGAAATHRVESDKTRLVARAEELLAACGLTWAAIESAGPALRAPAIPAGLTEDKAKAFLDNVERNLKTEAANKAIEASRRFSAKVADFTPRAEEVLLKTCEEAGPGQAADLSREISQRLHKLDSTVEQAQRAAAQGQRRPKTSSVTDQLEAIFQTQQAAARAKYLAEHSKAVQGAAADLDALDTRLNVLRDAVEELSLEYDRKAERFASDRAAPLAVLDEPALRTRVQSAVPACRHQVLRCAAETLASGVAAEHFKAEARGIVARHAAAFRPLADMNEAIRAAGTGFVTAVKNAVAAAEPSVRLEPYWNSQKYSSRRTFVTIPDGHPAMELVGRSGRLVYCAPPSIDPNEMVFISVDYGLEIGALKATQEALAAHLKSQSDFPPFADRNYKPKADLVVPDRHEWLPYLTIPAHLHLDTGIIRIDDTQGWFYKDVFLGRGHVEASEALRNTEDRDRRLPGVEELSRQTKEAIIAGRKPGQIVRLLQEIAAKLDEHIAAATHELCQLLMRELAVVRALLTEYQESIASAESHWRIWGKRGLTEAADEEVPPHLKRGEADGNGKGE